MESYSRWFKVALCLLFVLYASLWLFTIHIRAEQQAQHITPTLPVLAEDSAEYDALVQSMLRGGGFAMNGQLETLRTPGYPIFVAAIQTIGGGSYFAVTFVQIFITIISALVIRRIGIRFASRNVGEAAALLVLLNPVTITLTLLLYSDILFLLLFTSGFYVALSLDKKRFVHQVFLASLLFGLAIYVRPVGLLAIPIFIAPIVASRLASNMKWKAAGILLVCILLLLSPWMMRNYVRTGVFSFTSIGNFATSYAVARFIADTDGIPLDTVYRTLEDKIGSPQSTWRDIRVSQKVAEVSVGVILEKPFSYVAYQTTTSLTFLFPSTIQFALDIYNDSIGRAPPYAPGAIHFLAAGDLHAFYQGILAVWWKVLERLVWLCVSTIALYAVWRRRRDMLAWVFVFIVGYLMMLTGPTAGPRYTLQAFPFLFILFATGCGYLLEKFNYFRASK